MDMLGFAGGAKGCPSLSGLARGRGSVAGLGQQGQECSGAAGRTGKPGADPVHGHISAAGERPRVGPCSAGVEVTQSQYLK